LRLHWQDIAAAVVAARKAGKDARWLDIEFPSAIPGPEPPPAESEPSYTFFDGRFRVEPAALSAFEVGSVPRNCGLTPTEFRIVHCLGRVAGTPVIYEGIKRAVWPEYNPATIATKNVAIHVKRLRSKLGPAGPEAILTAPGIGYWAVP